MFSYDMADGANLFKENHRNVAFIDGEGIARDGIVVVRLASIDYHRDVRFCKKEYL